MCSATVENKTSGLFKTALSTEQSKNAETACQGTLLLWDLKTLKLEVGLICRRLMVSFLVINEMVSH